MKIMLVVCFAFFSVHAIAEENVYSGEKPINNSAELSRWCESVSSQYYLAKDLVPANWTSSRWAEDNNLFVEGSWRIGNKKHLIKCSVRNGVAEKYANWKILNQE